MNAAVIKSNNTATTTTTTAETTRTTEQLLQLALLALLLTTAYYCWSFCLCRTSQLCAIILSAILSTHPLSQLTRWVSCSFI